MLLHCPEPGRYLDAAGRACTPAALRSGPAGAGNADPLILALPASRCLFTTVPVTPAEQRHLARLLPWKLEDSLVAPAEELHFAWTPLREGEAAVTAVARDWLARVLEQARADGLQATQVICELALLPWQEGSWCLRLQGEADEQQCLLRHAQHQGLVCSPSNLPVLLQALAAESGAMPARLLLQGETTQLQALLAQMPAAWCDIVQETVPLGQQTFPSPSCNLLQGAFAAPLPWGRWWRQWRVAVLLLLVLLVGDVLLTGAGIWRERQALAQLQEDIRREAETVLPGAVLADPVLQLRRVVAAQGGDAGNGAGGLLSLLTRMAPALEAQPGVQVEGLDYNGARGELQLLVETRDFAAVEGLRAALERQGLKAELLGSSRNGERSRSRLKVKG